MVAALEHSFLLSGAGELIEPDDGVVAVGSGGNYALAAARALLPVTGLSARDIVQRSLEIAADICVFTNNNITVLELPESGERGRGERRKGLPTSPLLLFSFLLSHVSI